MGHGIFYGSCGHVVMECTCAGNDKIRYDVNYLCTACTDKRRQEAADMMDRLQPCAVNKDPAQMANVPHDHAIVYSGLCGHVVVECRCGMPFTLDQTRHVDHPCHVCAAELSRDEVQDLMDTLPTLPPDEEIRVIYRHAWYTTPIYSTLTQYLEKEEAYVAGYKDGWKARTTEKKIDE